MDAATRKAKLIEVRANQDNIVMTGIPLRYKGKSISSVVYRIPLDYLIYNKYNGRIGSAVLSYETQNGSLDAQSVKDQEIIEDFLYKSKEDRNERTMASLIENGQQRYGIVTADGIIIDGNRRAIWLVSRRFPPALTERRWPVEPMPARVRRSQNMVVGAPSRPAIVTGHRRPVKAARFAAAGSAVIETI